MTFNFIYWRKFISNPLPLYYDESDTAIFVMEDWVCLITPCATKSSARWFLFRIEAFRHNLLIEEATKNLKEEAELWLAQDPAINRRKSRITLKQKKKEVSGEWWEQVAAKIKERYARERTFARLLFFFFSQAAQ